MPVGLNTSQTTASHFGLAPEESPRIPVITTEDCPRNLFIKSNIPYTATFHVFTFFIKLPTPLPSSRSCNFASNRHLLAARCPFVFATSQKMEDEKRAVKNEKTEGGERGDESPVHQHVRTRRIRAEIFTDSPFNWMFSGVGDETVAGRRMERGETGSQKRRNMARPWRRPYNFRLSAARRISRQRFTSSPSLSTPSDTTHARVLTLSRPQFVCINAQPGDRSTPLR